MNIQTVKNVSDCVPLYLPHSLYLKPFTKLNISVSLPQTVTGKTISNWDVMEKLRKIIQPDQFSVLKVSKSTLEFIRFDAELEEVSKVKNVISRLDGRPLKLGAFPDALKIRASQAKDNFPSRHDWDSFFRDTRDMDEMKAGERPDTIHIANLPIRWFCPRHMENEENVKPSESIFKRIFEKFGEVRQVDIPICDPYRKDMKSHMTGMKTFSFDQELYFEGYIQFSEYLGFVKTMDEFRGMKLIRKDGDKNLAANIIVDFDRSKHLSDANVKRRKILRDRFIARDQAKEEEEKKRQKAEEEEKERERCRKESQKMAELERQRQREERRKEKHLKKLREKEEQEMSLKIHNEEKKLLLAQRKLEGIRVLGELFDRIKLNPLKKIKIKQENVKNHPKKLGKNANTQFIDKVKSAQQHEIQKLEHKLKKAKSDVKNQHQQRSPSINTISSISSDDSVLNDNVSGKKKTKKRKKNDSSSTSLSTEPEDITNKLVPAVPPAFPMFDPETGQWMGMTMGMYPYTAPFLPGTSMVRPDFFANAMFRGFRGRGRYPRQRSRGGYRGRGPYHKSYDRNYYDNDHYDDEHDHRKSKYSTSRSRSRGRRSRSNSRRSRSRSRSRSRYHRSRRSRSRSRSRSRNRRTRSRSKSHRRSSRSRSHSQTKSKLVSTLRKSKSSNRWSSRSRSRSYSRSSRAKHRSWSHDAESPKHRHTHSNTTPDTTNKIVLQPEKLVRSAKEIQRSVQQKLLERVQIEEKRQENVESRTKNDQNNEDTTSTDRRKRSISVDSSKFISPKRKEMSETPEKS